MKRLTWIEKTAIVLFVLMFALFFTLMYLASQALNEVDTYLEETDSSVGQEIGKFLGEVEKGKNSVE